jgi:isoamyl acetate esterase
MTPLVKSLGPVLLLIIAYGCATRSFFLRSGDRIVVLGDSITQLGDEPSGYITLIRTSLARTRPGVEVLNAGISGNKVTDLQQRLEKDVLAMHPAVVFVFIGINDVWHWALPGHQGTTPALFESELRRLVGRIRDAGAHVVLCTPTVIGEKRNGANPQDAELDRYAAISRRIAEETGTGFCDLRAAFVACLQVNNPADAGQGILTRDRVHLNESGNKLVAELFLNEIARW